MSKNDQKWLKMTEIESQLIFKGCNGTLRLQCQCGYKAFVNMSGGSSQGQTFDELVTKNMVVNNLKVADLNKFLTGINMRAQNFNNQVTGINLEHARMSDMRNEVYSDIIQKKCDLEDEMMKSVVASSDYPEFAYDAYYSDR